MSIEKDIKDLTAAINNLAEALREGRVTVSGAAPSKSPKTETSEPAGESRAEETGETSGGRAEATVLTFEDVKAAFLGIAKAVGDPVKGAERSKAVLARYGAAKMKDVEEAKWPAFVEDCRAAAAVAQ